MVPGQLRKKNDVEDGLQPTRDLSPAEAASPAAARLTSLDVFRGITVAFMILVNNPGSWQYVYPPLRHADWHGWTPTDLVFPFFLWIVGVSMTLSFARRIERGDDRSVLWRHALRRGALIFLIGFLLNLIPRFDFEHVRIMGVLQRIGLCYMIGATIYLYTGVRGQIVATVAILLGYWPAMMWIPVPGYGAGVLEKEGNFAQFIDSKMLAGHMWASSKTWDPEGLLSTLPAVCNVLFGVLTARMLSSTRRMIALGAVLTAAGLLWGFWFPINKALWTSSYVLFTCGLATLCFLIVKRIGPLKPFEIVGMNALAVYVGSGILAKILSITGAHRWLWDHFYSVIAAPINGSLLFALSEVLIFLLLAWWMWSRKIFVKL